MGHKSVHLPIYCRLIEQESLICQKTFYYSNKSGIFLLLCVTFATGRVLCNEKITVNLYLLFTASNKKFVLNTGVQNGVREIRIIQ